MIDIESLYKPPQEIAWIIAENFQKKRKRKRISRKALSLATGVSYASIRRFEETGSISLTSLLKLASYMDSSRRFQRLFFEMDYVTMEEFLRS